MRSMVFASSVVSLTLAACGASSPPNASITGANYPDTVHVAIAHDGTATFDGKPVDGAELTSRTRDAARQHPGLKLIVDAERETSFQVVLAAVERMKAGGASNISIGTLVAASPSSAGGAHAAAEGAGQAAAPTTKAATPVTGPTPTPRATIPPGTKWDCPFPSTGERGGKNEANVLVRVHVESDGKPVSVDVLEDPGGGFGAAARRCALEKSYEAARDVNGQPVRSATFPFYIQFVMK